jgi:small subunit ribosomal protein S20
MPNSPSAKKRFRQSEVRRTRNRAVRSEVRSAVRRVRAAVASGDVATSEEAFRKATKMMDQAAAKKVYHANTVSRVKSRLSHAIKKIKQAS